MKANTRIITTFIGGAALGALISFALLKEKYEAQAEEEIKAMKDYYQKEMEAIDDDYEKELNNLVDIMDGKDKLNKKEMDTYVDYVKKFNPGELVEEKDYNAPYPIDDEEIMEAPDVNDILYEEPFLITKESYEEDYDHFDKISVIYYDEDDVVADDRGEVISNIEEVIGLEFVDAFGDEDDPNVVHVRNGRLGSDYEILMCHSTYTKEVLGFDD